MAESFFAAEAPVNTNNNDGTSYTLGLRFTPQVDGQVTHLAAFIASLAPDGDVTFLLYRNSDQQVLASEARSPALAAGDWLMAELAAPVDVLAGVAYTAAYFTSNRYVSTGAYPWPVSSSAGNLISADPGGYFNGSFTPAYPDAQFGGGNYFADLVFEPADESGPAVTVWNGTIEVPAAVTVWDGATEQPVTIEVTT